VRLLGVRIAAFADEDAGEPVTEPAPQLALPL
jgi:hypothetical protein